MACTRPPTELRDGWILRSDSDDAYQPKRENPIIGRRTQFETPLACKTTI
ncbi:predicted protein [Arabidopsis lyrata subsp. lyrata]|uniref:Predicted protein n=1 Tax=Arabidopsis lyrata subsp. lyrata TaxID=81972 RepID=D7MGY6_ARALL|nr:predicted protein [Arabidopsis lyrata subsp. lyrata]